MTRGEIIKGHYSCTCDEIYTSRNMIDPDCIFCCEGGEIELIMDEWAAHIAKTVLLQHGISENVAHYTVEELLNES